MKMIKKKDYNFNRSIYDSENYCIITNPKFWDGGIDKSASLEEKREFYSLASQFSEIVKQLIIELDDIVLTGSHFCEKYTIFEFWRDKESYDCFNNISEFFKKNKQYKLELPDDNEYIDFIIENNFRYLTCFDLFLPKNNIILRPTCHTSVIIRAYDYERVKESALNIIEKYEGFSLITRLN